jgi:hypothetical protein
MAMAYAEVSRESAQVYTTCAGRSPVSPKRRQAVPGGASWHAGALAFPQVFEIVVIHTCDAKME